MNIPIVLTIAGSDPSGGAGIQADLRSFARLKVYGLSVITAVTAQSTTGVQGVFDIPAEFVSRQLEVILADMSPLAVKTGMLGNAAIVDAISTVLKNMGDARLVVDPVLVSTSGAPLLKGHGVDHFRNSIIPLATVLTPNLDEAETLTGGVVRDVSGMERAARQLAAMGARSVLVKGGHLAGDPIDVFFDGNEITHLKGVRITGPGTHGTGCVLSAAITAYLAYGRGTYEAVCLAKEFVTEAIRNQSPIGRGANVLLR